jgi:hypothetical protein
MIGQLQTKTGALFDRTEIAKHLKHKFLEWDFRVNKILGKFKETSILSMMSSSGGYLPSPWSALPIYVSFSRINSFSADDPDCQQDKQQKPHGTGSF